MKDWEIVAGDFGGSYKATAEGLNLSGCTATIKVWQGSTLLFDESDCGTVYYDEDEDESYCYYDVVEDDIPTTAAVDDIERYSVMVEFISSGFQEHSLKFDWVVHPAPPSS